MPEGDGSAPNEDVEREFETAEQMLVDARKATGVGISKATVVNRLSDACFHAAQVATFDSIKSSLVI